MNCAEFEGLLSDFLENDLEVASAGKMRDHLDSCPSCSTLLEEVTELRKSLSDFPWIEPDEKLVDCILERTSGRAREKCGTWSPVMAWFKPVFTQRHVFATLMILVFFSFATNILGPEFTASGQSGLNPAMWSEKVSSISGDLYRKWREFQSFKQRVGDEIGLLQDDLIGRLNYHLTMILFKSYEESIKDENVDSPDKPGTAQEGKQGALNRGEK